MIKCNITEYTIKTNKRHSHFEIIELEDVSLIEINAIDYDIYSLKKGDSITIVFTQEMTVSRDNDFRDYPEKKIIIGELNVIIDRIFQFNDVAEITIDSFDIIKFEEHN